jgi:hypothetical protein
LDEAQDHAPSRAAIPRIDPERARAQPTYSRRARIESSRDGDPAAPARAFVQKSPSEARACQRVAGTAPAGTGNRVDGYFAAALLM